MSGVNGAGKSTIGAAYFDTASTLYINPDKFQRENGLTIFEAGREIVRLTQASLSGRQRSLAIESTLSAHRDLALLRQANRLGYDTGVYYIGLSSPELHIERVKARVSKGGHDIPEEDIRRRISRSHANLIQSVFIANEVLLLDNSGPTLHQLLRFTKTGSGIDIEIESTLTEADLPPWANHVLQSVVKGEQK